MSAEAHGILIECDTIHAMLRDMSFTRNKRSIDVFYGQQLILGHRLLKTLFTYRVLSDERLSILQECMERLAEISDGDTEAMMHGQRILLYFAREAVHRLKNP
jgi:hypothetical protein